MCKDTNTTNSHQNHSPININKQEAVKAKVKIEEDDISTDDERSSEYVPSSSGYDPVKSEETDDEELSEDNNISNEQHLPIKEECEKTEDVSTDDEHGSEMKEPSKPPARNKAPVQEKTTDIQPTKKRRYSSKRKRIAEESNESIQKSARIKCSVEGCKRKVLDSGKCWKHKGYKYCNHDGCTMQLKREEFVSNMGLY